MNIDISIQPQARVSTDDLRVAIISDSAPARNGVGTYYVDLMEHLKSRVAKVEMFCPTIDENGKWHAGLALPLPGDSTQKLCFPNPFAMRRMLKQLQPDIIIIATPGVYGMVGAFWASQMNIPAIAGFHTSFEQLTELYWKDTATGKLFLGYFKVSNSYLFKKCQLVLANSEEMIQLAQELKAPKVKLISTVLSPTFTNFQVKPFSGQLKRVLFAGRLAPEKNIDTVIEAAQENPNLEFTLAGDGPLREEIDAHCAELPNLRCLGWLDREALRDAIDEHDMLILPSHFESFGTIALEAMSRQRLVAVSRGCGIADWPEFSEGLFVMDELQSCLNELSSLDSEALNAKAQTAKQLTEAINETNLNHWCQVLVENQKGS